MDQTDDRETLVLAVGSIRIEIRSSKKDMEWLRPLFTRNAEPFRALRDMGYEQVPANERPDL